MIRGEPLKLDGFYKVKRVWQSRVAFTMIRSDPNRMD